jgi:cytosine permease
MAQAAAPSGSPAGSPAGRHWSSVAGAWMGIGTSPGALLLGAGLVVRQQGMIPLAAILLGLVLIAAVVWAQGQLGLQPPWGEDADLSQVAERYFTPAMRRIFGILIAAGMTGWFGVNVGMGASALAALVPGLPRWLAVLLIGGSIAGLALRGLRGWNRLATVTTACVLALVVLVLWRYHGRPGAVTVGGAPLDTLAGMGAMLGYVGVFSLRAPDFTVGMPRRRDLRIVTLLLVISLGIVVLAGAVLGERSGSADLIGVLAGPGGLAIGNLLIALAVIAPTFTTFYSGAPALRGATGLAERPAMIGMACAGLALALGHFDLLLLPWLAILGAVLPPVVVPLVTEFTLRHRGRARRAVPAWPWLAGAAPAAVLALVHSPLALVAGFVVTGAATIVWQKQQPAMPAPTPEIESPAA